MGKPYSSLVVAVIGCGSIGLRHLQNLRDCGVKEIIACDTNQARLNDVRRRFRGIMMTSDYKSLLKSRRHIDAALIAAPTHLHVPLAFACAKRGINLFIEKPLSHSLARVDLLIDTVKRKGIIAMMAMCYRFHPTYQAIKDIIDQGTLGTIYSMDISSGHYLPAWHPEEDYRKEYSARKEMGGGVILTSGIHSFDAIRWIFGEVNIRSCVAGKVSNLAINVEDIMECVMQSNKNVMIRLHLDFLRREKDHRVTIVGEKGIIEADIVAQKIRMWFADKKIGKTIKNRSPLNAMYKEEMRHFLKALTRGEESRVGIQEGKKSLMLALAARKQAHL